jgi:hypothetical protein
VKADQFLKQGLLVGEVEIDRALGDAGAPRHAVKPRGSEAAGGKFIKRRAEDRLPARRSLRHPNVLAQRSGSPWPAVIGRFCCRSRLLVSAIDPLRAGAVS